MGVLKTIAIIVIGYYVFKAISRLIFPLFVKQMMKNVEKKYNAQQRGSQDSYNEKVGETVIDKKPSQKQGNKNVGDYVDFEEIND